MEIKPIRTEEDYLTALEEIDAIFDAEPDTPEGDKLDILVTLVEAYEEKHHKIPLPDPIEAIEFHMERQGISRKDLEPYIGNRARVSEILNRKRALSLRMIRNLSKGLGIPTEILVQEYPIENDVDKERAYEIHKAVAADIWFSNLENPISIYNSSAVGESNSLIDTHEMGISISFHRDFTSTNASYDSLSVCESPVFLPDWPTRSNATKCENDQPNQAGNTRLQRIMK